MGGCGSAQQTRWWVVVQVRLSGTLIGVMGVLTPHVKGLTPPVMLGGLEPPPPAKGPRPGDAGFFHFLPQHHPYQSRRTVRNYVLRLTTMG